MKKVKVFAIALVALVGVTSAKAQFSVSTDIVSNYVWRGVEQDATLTNGTPNIQPSLSYSTGNFTIGTWGSYAILGTVKEVDLYASYKLSDLFSLTVTDYNWNFTDGDYFNYDGHVFEGTINYAGVESFPLSVSLNTMFAGADKKGADDSQAYSTYVELGYPISSNASLFLGSALNESNNYGTDGFAVTNLGLKLTKSIDITDKFSLPLYGVIGCNPNAKDAFLVVGITL